MSTAPPPLDQLSHADAWWASIALRALMKPGGLTRRSEREWDAQAWEDVTIPHVLMKRLYAMDLLWWRKSHGVLVRSGLSEAGEAILPELRIWLALVGDAIADLDRDSEEERTTVFTSGTLTKSELKAR